MRFHGKSLVESILGCKLGCRNQNTQKYEHQAEYYLHGGKQEKISFWNQCFTLALLHRGAGNFQKVWSRGNNANTFCNALALGIPPQVVINGLVIAITRLWNLT